jgi:hypothetical protein
VTGWCQDRGHGAKIASPCNWQYNAASSGRPPAGWRDVDRRVTSDEGRGPIICAVGRADRRGAPSPAWTLFAIVILGAMFGILGVALAAPLLAVGRIALLRHYIEDRLNDRSAGQAQGS